MKAVVVGGGIGGLSAAIALRRASVEAVEFCTPSALAVPRLTVTAVN